MESSRWENFTKSQQLLTIGAEFMRAKTWQGKELDKFLSALERALELIDLTISDSKWRNNLPMIMGLRQEVSKFYIQERSTTFSNSTTLYNFFIGASASFFLNDWPVFVKLKIAQSWREIMRKWESADTTFFAFWLILFSVSSYLTIWVFLNSWGWDARLTGLAIMAISVFYLRLGIRRYFSTRRS